MGYEVSVFPVTRVVGIAGTASSRLRGRQRQKSVGCEPKESGAMSLSIPALNRCSVLGVILKTRIETSCYLGYKCTYTYIANLLFQGGMGE